MDHIKCYENFQEIETLDSRIRSEIESILENLDINLNIDEWGFFPNSNQTYDVGVQYHSTVIITLTRDNLVRKILEELRYIILGIEGIDGVKLANATWNFTNILRRSDHPDYMTQLDILETPNRFGKTYWVSSIQIHILYDLPLNRGAVGKNRR